MGEDSISYFRRTKNFFLFPIVVCGVILVAWIRHDALLEFLDSHRFSVNPMTAVALILAGFATGGSQSSSPTIRHFALFCTVAFISIGLLKLGWLAGWCPWPVDLLLFPELLEHPPSLLSRMAPNTALNLVLHGFALLLYGRQSEKYHSIITTFLSFEAVTALMALLIYLYDARTIGDIGVYFPMALPTCLSFLCLSIGQLCTPPHRGVIALLFAQSAAGLTTRRLVLGGILVPVAIGWITQKGEEMGFYHSVLTSSLFCVLLIVCFLAIVFWNGASLARFETMRAQHQQELRDSEERFKRLTHAHNEGIVISVGGIVQDANPQFCQMHGYALEEIIGQPLTLFAAPHCVGKVQRNIQLNANYQSVGRRKDGSEFEIEILPHTIPFQGQDARVSVVRDITERRAVERMKDEFVSVVSHELRTPLTSIYGSLRLLSGNVTGELPAASRSLVDVASRNSQKLLLLINDLLDMQKIESGQMTFAPHEFLLSPLVHRVIESHVPYAEPLQVCFELSQDAPDLKVNSDEERLAQVIGNLLSNAAKFSSPDTKVQIRLLEAPHLARIEVEDKGVGIAPEFQEKIFHKFAQADSSATRAKGGTGLGLSISKSIIEQLGGNIGFTTAPGQGTTFFVEIPTEDGVGA